MPKYLDPTGWDYMQFDIETKDPELTSKGPGVYRKDGYVVGVAIGGPPGAPSEYYALAHPETRKKEAEANLSYLREVLGLDIPKLGANLPYDVTWMQDGYGCPVKGLLYDVQVAEALLNENRRTYSLQALGVDYLGDTKKDMTLVRWCEQHGIRLSKDRDAVKHLWKMPYDVARPYALGDIDIPGRVFEIQKRLLEEQGLWDLFILETKDLRPVIQMRSTGVRVDKNRMLKLGMAISDEAFRLDKKLTTKMGRPINPKSSKDTQFVMDKLGLEYPYNPPTEKMKEKGINQGNPQLNKDVLSRYTSHEEIKAILDLRHLTQLNSLYIHPYYEMLVGDRLHATFNPLRKDDGGTVSGRFSGSNPNLQQVSSGAEDEDLTEEELAEVNPMLRGKVIRDLFIPEEDHDWLKHDWSQIEYRIIAHYAKGPLSDEIRRRYTENPNTDYHEEMMQMTGLPNRKVTKTLNFGAAYGMGWYKMAVSYGWPPEYAKEVYNLYHYKVPFVKVTANRVANAAESRGYIKTILGRRARLINPNKSYVMFNRLIQGSAADLMKKAMVDAYEAGLFEVLPVHMTVHDELDNSIPRTAEGREAARELKNIMETCVPLRVPVIADAEIGPTWGSLKEFVV